MNPFTHYPEEQPWIQVRRAYRRRHAIKRAIRGGAVLALIGAATWYAVAHGVGWYYLG